VRDLYGRAVAAQQSEDYALNFGAGNFNVAHFPASFSDLRAIAAPTNSSSVNPPLNFTCCSCDGLPQARSNSSRHAATDARASLPRIHVASRAIAATVCSAAAALTSCNPFGRPPGFPLRPRGKGRPTLRFCLVFTFAMLLSRCSQHAAFGLQPIKPRGADAQKVRELNFS